MENFLFFPSEIDGGYRRGSRLGQEGTPPVFSQAPSFATDTGNHVAVLIR